ncbi:MAG: glycosyltransferase family 2 protein [bacterium]|nr:glycosyltransferase family 2 protein [bacterium]
MKKTGSPSISAVIPAFNEAGNIAPLCREFNLVLKDNYPEYEIVVVDDGSSDQTASILKKLQGEIANLRVITHKSNQGYGKSLRDGFDAAAMDYIFYTDGDNQFDIEELTKFPPLLDEADAVLGYRIKRAEGVFRHFTSRCYNILVSILFGLRVRDIDCSFKLFPASYIPRLKLKSDKFFIDTELIIKMKNAGARFAELGVTHKKRHYGRTTVSPIHVFTTLYELAANWSELREKR